MNELDSSQMARMLKQKGFQAAQDPEHAEIVLINTCSVREKPTHKLYSEVGKLRKLKLKNPNMLLGVTGCQAQAEGKALLKRFSYLDLVLAPDQIPKLPQMMDDLSKANHGRYIELNYTKREDYQFVDLLPDENENAIKAFVNIMKGCDNFCSFCIVPYTRGREVSRAASDIIQEIKILVEQGVQEIMLLGQNVNSYGNKTPGSPDFVELLYLIASETKLKRLRFTTSHPKDFNEKLMQAFVDINILMPQMHLPIQSGSNDVLARMYRGYTVEEYCDKINLFKEKMPHAAISTDIIVGFPGETEADFAKTLKLIQTIAFDSIYAFHYSPRPKTTAAKYFKDDVSLAIKEQRLAELLALQNQISYEKNLQLVGSMQEILVDTPSREAGMLQGRTPQSRIVHFAGKEALLGSICHVKITEAMRNSLIGTLC